MSEPKLDGLPLDDSRGTMGMALFIASEAIVFVCLFFAYFYLGHSQPLWPPELPKLEKPIEMLVVLLTSSVVLHLADRLRSRTLLALTIVLGFVFVAIQLGEYREHLQSLTPQTNTYGSIFYALTSMHALHMLLGLSMLIFALALPRLEPRRSTPHRPLHNATLYWHFVDAVWVLIVGLVYVLPHLQR
jgi:heme/copper-type cytochrome/quinol oxidase subunit 3